MSAAVTCPGCGSAMEPLALDGHYGRQVHVDSCSQCGGLWFDGLESQQLSAGGTLQLLERLSSAEARPVQARSACPRCRQPLTETSDQQRGTRFTYRRCHAGHGRFITAYQFLREKHLVRELTPVEIASVRHTIQQVNCVNCGAPVEIRRVLACAHCGTPVSMVDPDQLRRELEALGEADARHHDVDPMLPIRLLQERAAAQRAWRGVPGDTTWIEDLLREQREGGFIRAALKLLGTRLG